MSQKIKTSTKKPVIKKKTVLSKESEKSENKTHGKDQKKIFTIGDSMLKNIPGTRISRENKDETSSRCYNY